MGNAHKDALDQGLNELIQKLLRSTETRLGQDLPKDQQELICGSELTKVRSLVMEFEQTPKHLDAYLQQHVDGLSRIYFQVEPGSKVAVLCSTCFYQLCVVRKYKHIVNFLSDDVSFSEKLIERVLDSRIEEFETYLLLLWLSSIVMIPLPLEGIRKGLRDFLYELSIENLRKNGSASMTQKISAVLLSRLLTRSDCDGMLVSYLSNCFDKWPEWEHGEKLGHLMTIKLILKQSSNTSVASYTAEIYDRIVLADIQPIKYRQDLLIPNTNILYLMRILSRLARFHLNQAGYENVSAIVNNYINDILNPLASRFDIALRESMAKCLSKIVSFLQLKAVNYAEQLVWYVTKQLRIPEFESCPSKYDPDVSINTSNLSVAKYHTALLFYGFLFLNRVCHIDFLPALLSLIHKTLFISSIQFSIVQGSQIRDASCFCLWALFRSLPPIDFERISSDTIMIHDIWADIIRVLICDEDFTIRRCAVPVLQEFIGRFGPILAQTLKSPDARRLVELTASLVDSERALSGRDLVQHGYPALLLLPPLIDVLTSQNVEFGYYLRCSTLLLELLEAAETFLVETVFDTSVKQIDHQKVLLDSFRSGNALALIPLGLLVRSGAFNPESLVMPGLDNVLSRHSGFTQKISHFFWYSSCIIADKQDEVESFWALYLPVIGNEASSKGDIKKVVTMSLEATTKVQMPASVFDELCKRLRYGSPQIATLLPWSDFGDSQRSQLILMISDKSVDAETRAALINGNTVLCFEQASSELPLLDLLDDYTLTNKGDVGLKVRIACLKHCLENNSHGVESSLRVKVVRLAAESMDSVRNLAFALLTGDHVRSLISITYEKYYSKLLGIYATFNENERAAFWRGLVHSVAGLKVSKALVNQAFRLLIVWFENALLETKEQALAILLRQLKLTKPFAQLEHQEQKTLLSTLNLFVKLFEASVELPLLNHTALFVRAYNLQLNAPATRTALAFRIFHHLSLESTETSQKARQRVCQIFCQTSKPQIRRLAQDTLFEIINDLVPSNISLLNYTHETYKPTPAECKDLESQLSYI